MHERAFRRATALAAAAFLIVASGAVADTVAPNPDAPYPDGITVDGSGTFDLGTVAPGAVVSVAIPFRLTCGGTGGHVSNGAYVWLSYVTGTVPLDGSVAAGNAAVGPVSGWPADGGSCFDPPQVVTAGSPSQVDITAPTVANAPGTHYTYTLEYRAVLSDGDTAALPPYLFFDVDLVVSGDIPPTLDLPAPMTVEGDTTGGADVAYSATATDPEDGTLTPTCAPASGAFFALGTTSVTCTVSDSAGHTVSGAFDVTVLDRTPPSIGPVGPVALTTADPSGTTAEYTLPSASDVVDPSPTVACLPGPGTHVPVGTTTVVCTATDASGNIASASFPLTVTYVPPVTYAVVFEEPIGSADAAVVNPGRTLPVKATILRDGVAVTSGRVELSMTDCSSGALLAGPLPMAFTGGRWDVGLDTSPVAVCARGTVRLDGKSVGGFDLTASASSLVTPAAKGPRAGR